MGMLSVVLLSTVGLAFGQQTCMYKGGPDGDYSLNLTEIAGWRLEYKSGSTGYNYYMTPCQNGEQCQQGNANFYGNAIQMVPGANQCSHFLSVDHHESPQYLYGGASWMFDYRDGEICDSTQQPRELTVFYLCDENLDRGAYIEDVYEYDVCKYSMQVRTPHACIPKDKHSAKCQWKTADSQGKDIYLDLSSQKGVLIRGPLSSNGYEQFYSPCQNALHCYQQAGGDIMVQSILENTVTHTCELYLSEWQDGRVEPVFHDSKEEEEQHWSFHYWLSEKCMSGEPGEETIRWYCDPKGRNATLINATYDGDCKHEMNIMSPLACPDKREKVELYDLKELYAKYKL